MPFRIDLHTHTMYSGDSSTTVDEYIDALSKSGLSLVAVTDHLTISGALGLKTTLGKMVVIGQEFRTKEGEMIGLYLDERIPPSLTAKQASRAIRSQGGLVYIPHPGDATRGSISQTTTVTLAKDGYVDVVEVGNSKLKRPSLGSNVTSELQELGVGLASSSDAHIPEALGSSHTILDSLPEDAEDLLRLLKKPGTQLVHNYFDPPRTWKSKIVPSQLNN